MAKRSRRARRQAKQEEQNTILPAAESSAAAPVAATPEPVVEEGSIPRPRQDSNFGQEYFYVYTDLRNILLVAVLMVGVLIGLSFII